MVCCFIFFAGVGALSSVTGGKDLVVFRFHVSVDSLCRAPSGLQFGPTVVAFRLTAISIAKEVAPDH